MKIYGLLVTLLIGVSHSYAQQALTDGPYIWHRGNQVVVKNVREQQVDRYVGDSCKMSKAQAQKKLFTVHLDKHPEWDFTVKLKTVDTPRGAVFSGTDHILVLSDIEGEFEPFRNLLISAKVIDEKYNWTFGTGKLVIAGDLFDRGKQVCQFLWLLYKLETEARAKGGDVHVILGNHDMMNLAGDYRYVQQEYGENASLMQEHYHDFYNTDSVLGKWLRNKNTIEKIGNLLIMHGGLSPAVLARHQPVEWINTACRPYYDVKQDKVPADLQVFFGNDALFWYRGYFQEPKAPMSEIDSTLEFYGCKKIIVGHTIVDTVITEHYDGKVLAVDVDEHSSQHEALLIEGEHWWRINTEGKKIVLF